MSTVVQCCSTMRFVSGLTLKNKDCMSCIAICKCDLSSHKVQLNEELVLRCVPNDGDSTSVASASTITYVPHPLMFVSIYNSSYF